MEPTTASEPPRRLTSADFHVGQRVRCRDPEGFVADWRNYLRDRTGVVEKVGPAERRERGDCFVNEVRVRWERRNGRGKERTDWFNARELVPLEASVGGPAPSAG